MTGSCPLEEEHAFSLCCIFVCTIVYSGEKLEEHDVLQCFEDDAKEG